MNAPSLLVLPVARASAIEQVEYAADDDEQAGDHSWAPAVAACRQRRA
jgi:hypothetical protein